MGSDLFLNYISSPIVQAKCINCHVEGGRSGRTRLVFQPSSTPDHGARNLSTIEHFLATVDDGANRILNKIQGMRHGGGVQVPAGSADFDNMEAPPPSSGLMAGGNAAPGRVEESPHGRNFRTSTVAARRTCER